MANANVLTKLSLFNSFTFSQPLNPLRKIFFQHGIHPIDIRL
jgi:hypothetical protein